MCRALTGLSLLLCVVLPRATWALNAGLGEPPATVNRETPYAAANGFLEAAHRGDYALAAHYLDLDYIVPGDQKAKGAKLARELKFVLDHKLLPTALSGLSKEPEGDPDNARLAQIDVLRIGEVLYPVRLSRTLVAGGSRVWVFSEPTVRSIEPLYAEYGPVLLGEELPAVLFNHPVLGMEPWQWLGLLMTILAALVLGVVFERLSLAVTGRLARWTRITWDDALVAAGRGPLRLLYFALLGSLGTQLLLMPLTARTVAGHITTTLSIIAVAWFTLRFLRVTAQFVHQTVEKEEMGRVRGLRTQLAVLRSVFEAATYIVSVALLLMQFELVRNVGVSLLASAGLAGVVIGLAAQKSISSLLAGIQLSFTQPILIGDNVVVEGEFGTVEEITLTYVVVKVWDERRLVIPIAQFLEKPFQNWSKGGQSMLGPVRLMVDFTTDLEALRAELRRQLEHEGKALWDGKVATVVVEDVLDRTMQLRVLLSATPDNLFDLRCVVREGMMVYLRERPEWLPTTRTESRSAGQSRTGEPSPGLPPPVAPRA